MSPLLLLAADTPEALRAAMITAALVPLAALAAVIFSVSVATHLLCWPERWPEDADRGRGRGQGLSLDVR